MNNFLFIITTNVAGGFANLYIVQSDTLQNAQAKILKQLGSSASVIGSTTLTNSNTQIVDIKVDATIVVSNPVPSPLPVP